MLIKKEQISLAKQKIIDRIANQARHGTQSKVLQKINKDFYCLGQFLDVLEISQRGVHGSAAGLRVLAGSNSNVDVIKGITRYLDERPDNERLIKSQTESIIEEKLIRDDKNVIKISEILYALSYVKPGHANTEEFKNKLKKKLDSGQVSKNGKCGWDYYIDENTKEIHLLPSAFAMIALDRNGYEVANIKHTIQNSIQNVEITHPSRFAEIIFCLYSLLNLNTPPAKEETKTYEVLLKKIWNSPFCSLENDYEQNIEYWYCTQHDYIRIPWQMYLIATFSKLSKFRYYTINTQRRLNSLVNNAKEDGFKYHYSGPNISTRTNAILFDMLSYVEKNLENSPLHTAYLAFDRVRQILGSKILKRIAFVVGIAFCTFTIYSWINDNEKKLSEIAPEFIGSIFLTLLALGKRK